MRVVLILALVVLAWYAYSRHQNSTNVPSERSEPIAFESNSTKQFSCDGRTHCSQMTSCEEATFFLKNCPNTAMDGDHDGIPCEQQWCH